jgi:hypothetical protein
MSFGTSRGLWLSLALSLLLPIASFPAPRAGGGLSVGAASRGEENPPKGAIKLTVEYSTLYFTKDAAKDAPKVVLVTLFSKGKALRSSELKDGRWAPWRGLAAGAYELHVEAEGYAKCVKHLILSDEEKEYRVHAVVGKRPLILGAGPSLEELFARLKKLEEKNAELQATVDQLRKDVEQRKKK